MAKMRYLAAAGIGVVVAAALILLNNSYPARSKPESENQVPVCPPGQHQQGTNSSCIENVNANPPEGSNATQSKNETRAALENDTSGFSIENVNAVEPANGNATDMTLANESQSVHQGTCRCIVIRIDDFQDYWLDKVQVGLVQLLENKSQPFSAGLIMADFGSDPLIANKLGEAHKKDLAEFDIHGWHHVDYSKVPENQQVQDFAMARDKLRQLYNTTPAVSLMPYNGLNNDTLQALYEDGYKVISSGLDKDHAIMWPLGVDKYGIKHIPETIEFSYIDTHGFWQARANSVIVNGLLNYGSTQKRGFSVLTLHPQDFANQDPVSRQLENSINMTKLDQLGSLIDDLTAQGIRFVPMEYVAAREP